MSLRQCVLTRYFSEISGRKWICGMNMSDSARFAVFGDDIHEFATMSLTQHFSEISGRKWI